MMTAKEANTISMQRRDLYDVKAWESVCYKINEAVNEGETHAMLIAQTISSSIQVKLENLGYKVSVTPGGINEYNTKIEW